MLQYPNTNAIIEPPMKNPSILPQKEIIGRRRFPFIFRYRKKIYDRTPWNAIPWCPVCFYVRLFTHIMCLLTDIRAFAAYLLYLYSHNGGDMQ